MGRYGRRLGLRRSPLLRHPGRKTGSRGSRTGFAGGLTSIPGAILGALIIGVTENLTVQSLASGYRDIIGFLVMVVVLIVRPQGLLGSKMRVV